MIHGKSTYKYFDDLRDRVVGTSVFMVSIDDSAPSGTATVLDRRRR